MGSERLAADDDPEVGWQASSNGAVRSPASRRRCGVSGTALLSTLLLLASATVDWRHAEPPLAAVNLAPSRNRGHSKRFMSKLRTQQALLREKEARSAWILKRLKDKRAREAEIQGYLEELRTEPFLVGSKEVLGAIKTLGGRGYPEAVVDIVRNLAGTGRANVYVYSAAVSVCEKTRMWESALGLLQQMKFDKVKPNEVTYNAAIAACGKSTRWQAALSLFEDMQASKLDPTEVTWSSVILACKRQWQQALQLKDEMLNRKQRGNLIVWTSVIRACEHSRRPREAIKTFGEMKKFAGWQPDLMTYHILLRACAKGSLFMAASKLLRKMESQGVTPDARAYGFAIEAARSCGARGADEVLRLFNMMREARTEMDSNACSAAMEAFEHKGEAERVLKMFDVVKQKGIPETGRMYAAAMRACAELGDVGRRVSLFKEYRSRSNIKPHASVYEEMVPELASSGKEDAALRLLGEMKRLKLTPGPKALAAAIEINSNRGNREPLKDLYKRAITECAKQSRSEDMLGLFEGMERNKLRPGAAAYNMAIASCQPGRSDPEIVLELLDAMRQRDLPAQQETVVKAMECCDQGDELRGVVDVFERWGGPRLGTEACSMALSALNKVGDSWEAAIAALETLKRENRDGLTIDDFEGAIAACNRGRRFEIARWLQGEQRRLGQQVGSAHELAFEAGSVTPTGLTAELVGRRQVPLEDLERKNADGVRRPGEPRGARSPDDRGLDRRGSDDRGFAERGFGGRELDQRGLRDDRDPRRERGSRGSGVGQRRFDDEFDEDDLDDNPGFRGRGSAQGVARGRGSGEYDIDGGDNDRGFDDGHRGLRGRGSSPSSGVRERASEYDFDGDDYDGGYYDDDRGLRRRGSPPSSVGQRASEYGFDGGDYDGGDYDDGDYDGGDFDDDDDDFDEDEGIGSPRRVFPRGEQVDGDPSEPRRPDRDDEADRTTYF